MIKVSLLITSLGKGGAERVASELHNSFSNQIDSQVVTLTNENVYELKKEPICLCINVQNKKIFPFLCSCIQGIIRYRNYLNISKPVISISFLTLDNIINVLVNLFQKRSIVVCCVHSVMSKKTKKYVYLGFFIRNLIKFTYKNSDKIIAVSNGVKNELVEEYKVNPEKIFVIHNPIDIQKIVNLSRENNIDQTIFNKPVIINIGRLSIPKGQWHLIKAFSEVRKKIECKLIICGDGELEHDLKSLAQSYCLNRDIIFLGWQKNPFKYLSKATVFVFPSLWEAMPMSLLESMACGCPIIATDCNYGPREIINNDSIGILIPPFDTDTFEKGIDLSDNELLLAEKIKYLINNEEKRKAYINAGFNRVQEFEMKKIIEQYEKLFLGYFQ